ncbi:hypothetical protein CYMTET_22712 [Cymbomonas tetramitiformis]|uniref:Reverse transcriptase domain-containing protein n=1 Tax=Cymbomonas tetramitiformis TaxID=36881 RepID=A0AAE0L204_9CHLO|nr:hypothetical protein CYMTET_22712 [Cymbomonas tetramitiformis]
MVEKGSSDGGTEREETTDRDQPEVTREPDAEMEEAAAKAVSQGGGTAQKVHAGSDGLVTDFVLTKWLKEFDTQKAKAVINTHAEASAKVLTFRDRQGGKGKASLVGGAGKAGANSEVMGWISKGAKMRWIDKAPEPFDHGVSSVDATPPQLEWMAAETEGCLKTSAWVRAKRRRHVSRVFLVPKPGTNKWRLVMDFRWLNAHCVNSRYKMETLKNFRRLTKPDDWCFSFDLQDGYHVVGIDPAFQEYMQFDVWGGAVPVRGPSIRWNDSPRMFVKVMKVLEECLRSPRSAADRQEVRKLQSGGKVRRRWAVRRRAGGCGREEHQQGPRVLSYMDDFLVPLGSRIEALAALELASRVLVRAERGEGAVGADAAGGAPRAGGGPQGGTVPRDAGKAAEDSAAGQGASQRGVEAATVALSSEACTVRRALTVGVPGSASGETVPQEAALRDLHQAGVGSEGEARAVGVERHRVVAPAAGPESVERSQDLAESDEGEATHRLLPVCVGRVLKLKHAVRGFWSNELRHLHITHMELEAVYKTVQSFLRELTGKVVHLHCDNQAVVAMLSHFASRNPELMGRMWRLWILLDLNGIELQARCAATVVAPYWPGQMGFQQLEALADKVVLLPGLLHSQQAGTFRAARGLKLGRRHVPHPCLPVSHYPQVVSRAAEHTPDGGLVPGCRVKVYWPVDDDWYVGTVGGTGADGLTHAAYDDGDQEDLDMSKERYEVIPVAVQKLPHGAGGADAGGSIGQQDGGQLLYCKNYRPKAQAFMQVCVAEGRQWLPATKATVRLYIAHLLAKRKVQAASMQPYLSAINNYHEDMGYSGPAKGRGVSRVVKGMSSLQMQAPDAAGEERTVRTWLPARHVSAVHAHRLGLQPVGRSETELLRACAYVVFAFVTFGRPDTGVSMLRAHISIADGIVSVVLHREKGRAHARLERRLTIPAAAGSEGRGSSWGLPWERGKLRSAQANDWVQLALAELGCVPPEGGHFSGHSTRKGACTYARAIGTALERCCFLGGWSQLSSAIHSYIDPTSTWRGASEGDLQSGVSEPQSGFGACSIVGCGFVISPPGGST